MTSAPDVSSPRGIFVGLTTLDVVHIVDHTPATNQKITATAQFIAAGGPAANAAVTFAALGGDAVLITAIGKGAVAGLILADLERYGVRVIDMVSQDHDRAPVSAVAVSPADGHRTVISIDATGGVVPAPTAATAAAHVEGAAVVLIDGHHSDLAVAVARAAHAAEIPLVVDAGRWKPVMADLLDFDPEMLCSDDFRVPGADSSAQTARQLSRRVTTVITTHGGDPVDYIDRGNAGSVEIDPVQAVDTLGAGDVFHGAYAFSVASGRGDLGERIAFAARVAGHRVATIGPRAWISSLATLSDPLFTAFDRSPTGSENQV